MSSESPDRPGWLEHFAGQGRAVLLMDSAMEDAAVVEIPDSMLGKRVVGVVTLSHGRGESCTPGVLRRASEQLADCKLPEWLLPVDDIPRNGLGGIDRRRLAQASLDLVERL